MHILNVFSIFAVLVLVGVESSVFAFINPAAWRLAPEPQLQMLSRVASVLGKVMPVWYPLCNILLAVETWLHWQRTGFEALLAATVLWVIASVGSIVLLVPLNTQVAEGDVNWQRIHHTWDSRHRIRTVLLATAGVLLTFALVR